MLKKLILVSLVIFTITLCGCDDLDNTYCPQTITANQRYYSGAPSIFDYSENLSVNLPKNHFITLYFFEADSSPGSIVANNCMYTSKNQLGEYMLMSHTPLKANINALKNNWTRDRSDNNGGLSCFYNAKHCPFMNY